MALIMLIWVTKYILYIHIDKERNPALKYLGCLCLSREKYYSDHKIIVIIGDMCGRMGPLNDSNCFTIDD